MLKLYAKGPKEVDHFGLVTALKLHQFNFVEFVSKHTKCPPYARPLMFDLSTGSPVCVNIMPTETLMHVCKKTQQWKKIIQK